MTRRDVTATAALALAIAAVPYARAGCSSTSTAARPTPPGARAWRSASRRRPARKVAGRCRRRPARCLAQVKAERANPKGDYLVGRTRRFATCRPPRTACSRDYRSPNLAQLLRLGAARSPSVSQNRVSGVCGGILALGYNTEIGSKKKLPVPEVLEGSRSTPRTRAK